MFTTFSAWVDLLFKAAGHKYIRRIPYTRGGKLRYRYIYKVTHTARGKHALHEDDVAVGAAFMLGTDKGAEVHAHVKSVDGDKVTVEYDDGPRKGEKETMSKRDLLSKLDAAHGISQALQSEREKQAKVVAELRASGASKKQIAREQARLDRLGASAEAPDALGAFARQVLEKARVTPEKVAAALTSFSKSPDTRYSPDGMFLTRLQQLTAGDVEASCERYNKALERAAQDNAAVLSAVEAYKQASANALTAPELDEYVLFEEVKQLKKQYVQRIEAERAQADAELKKATARVLQLLDDGHAPTSEVVQEAARELNQSKLKYDEAYAKKDKAVREAAKKYPLDAHHAKRRLEYIEASTGAFVPTLKQACADFMFSATPPKEGLHPRHNIVSQIRKFDQAGALRHVEEVLEKAYPARQLDGVIIDINIIQKESRDFRAECTNDLTQIDIAATSSLETCAHELAHTLENTAYYGRYTQGIREAVTLTHLTRITQGAHKQYSGLERYFEDQYTDNYTSKIYPNGATELVSMGVEKFFKATDPNVQLKAIADFAAADPHHYLLTYAILKGYTQP
jgi:hypothetical protein